MAINSRRTFVTRHQVRTRRTLGSIELPITQHAPKCLFHSQRQISQIHAFDLTLPSWSARVRSYSQHAKVRRIFPMMFSFSKS